MQPLDHDYRFGDAGRKATVGVYASELVPGVAVKSMTGTVRGEELFHRPELYRPWRSDVSQRHAEQLVGKEQEIEAQTKRNSELRTEVAGLQRELSKVTQQLKEHQVVAAHEREQEAQKLHAQISSLAAELTTLKTTHEHQLRVMRAEHESDVKGASAKLKLAQDGAVELGGAYFKQMQEVKSAASREVALIQQLTYARTAELQNELEASRDAVRRIQERTTATLAEMQQEMRRSEERCVSQMREQERRYEEMRSSLRQELHQVETDRDRLAKDLQQERDRTKSQEMSLQQFECAAKDNNVRFLSDLDQLLEYYSVTTSRRPGADSTSTNTAAPQNLVQRIAERLHQLTILKQEQTSTVQQLEKKLREAEGGVQAAHDVHSRQNEERDILLSRLQAEVNDLKMRQERLSDAFADVRSTVSSASTHLVNASHRLQFFTDDLNESLNHMGQRAPAPPKSPTLTLVCASVQGSAVQWEKSSGAMQIALSMANDALRAKMRQYAGYESMSDGENFIIAFCDPFAAIRFCAECQSLLLSLNWPPDILGNYDSREESVATIDGPCVVFRGLRYAMTVHCGPDIELVPTAVPMGLGDSKIVYTGHTVQQLLAVASICAGGQVLVTSSAFAQVRDHLPALGPIDAADLGQHRLSISQLSGVAAEMVGLVKVLPIVLKSRQFARKLEDTRGSPAGISQRLSPFNRSAASAEVSSLRSTHVQLAKAAETIDLEMSAVAAACTALSCRVREAQVSGREYSQADILAHIAAVDRLVIRMETVKRETDRCTNTQKDLIHQMRSTEEALIVATKVSITEDEFKKRIEAVQEQANEKIFETTLQYDHRIQTLRNAVAKAEVTIGELRRTTTHVVSSGAGNQLLAPATSSSLLPGPLPSQATADGTAAKAAPKARQERASSAPSKPAAVAPSKLKTRLQSAVSTRRR